MKIVFYLTGSIFYLLLGFHGIQDSEYGYATLFLFVSFILFNDAFPPKIPKENVNE